MENSSRPPSIAALRFALPADVEIVHWIPGRVRLRHPDLRVAQSRLEMASHIASQPGVQSVRVNALLACLIFTYDAGPAVRTSASADVRIAGFSVVDIVFSLIDVPIVGLIADAIEAVRFGRAAHTVMRRKHNGFRVHGVLAYAALVLVHTSLLDALLPAHLRMLVSLARRIASFVRMFARSFDAKSSAPLLSSAA